MPKAHPSTLTGQLTLLSQARSAAPTTLAQQTVPMTRARQAPLTLPRNPEGEYRRGFLQGEKYCTDAMSFPSPYPPIPVVPVGSSAEFSKGFVDGCQRANDENSAGHKLGDLDCRRKDPFLREVGGTSPAFQKGYRKGCDDAIKIRSWCIVHRDECVGPAWFPYVEGG